MRGATMISSEEIVERYSEQEMLALLEKNFREEFGQFLSGEFLTAAEMSEYINIRLQTMGLERPSFIVVPDGVTHLNWGEPHRQRNHHNIYDLLKGVSDGQSAAIRLENGRWLVIHKGTEFNLGMQFSFALV
jgi:hypothetical protein